MKFELPIVRPRALPEDGNTLRWREGPDLSSVAVVMLTGAIGGWLGMGNLARGATGDEATVAIVFVSIGGLLILAALGELIREERISVSGGMVTASRRDLRGRRTWGAPLDEFEGIAPVERGRRLFVRNMGLPATGRRGPVSEFVLVLRHRSDRARDLELFRAQPSLTVLHGMYTVRAHKGGPDVEECKRVARGYREALENLCAWLDKPALIEAGGSAPAAMSVDSLDLWLHPVDAEQAPAA